MGFGKISYSLGLVVLNDALGFRSFGACLNESFTFLGSTTDRLQSWITLIVVIILDENHLFNFVWLYRPLDEDH